MYKVLKVLAVVCVLIGSYALMEHGNYRDTKTMRSARMIDTSAEHTWHKSNHYYNTYGWFVDDETGLQFRDSIGDSLYRDFAAGGNKAIPVSWHYSIDKREQTSIGIFYMLFGLIGFVLTAFYGGGLAACALYDYRQRKRKLSR